MSTTDCREQFDAMEHLALLQKEHNRWKEKETEDKSCDIDEAEANKQKIVHRQNYFSVDQWDKLNDEFVMTKFPSFAAIEKCVEKTGLTHKQVDEWFEKRRGEWHRKLMGKGQPLIISTVEKLEHKFSETHYASFNLIGNWSKQIGLGEEQIQSWFRNRIVLHIREENKAKNKWLKNRRNQWESQRAAGETFGDNHEKQQLGDKTEAIRQKAKQKEDILWFQIRRDQWKRQAAEETSAGDKQNEKQKMPQNGDKTETIGQKMQPNDVTKLQNLSSDQLDILKGAFEERKYPDIFMLEELGRETGITVDQIKAWFQMRRAKHRHQKECKAKANDTQQKNPNANGIGIDSFFCPSDEQQKLLATPFKPLEALFKKTKYPNPAECLFLAMVTNLTPTKVKEWFKNRRDELERQGNEEAFCDLSEQKPAQNVGKIEDDQQKDTIEGKQNSEQNNVMLKQNAAVTCAKEICVECGQRIVHQTVPQCQPNANAIGAASIGCTSVSAVRGRAKCRRLFRRAVTFPMNAVAKLVKKVRSAKCAIANKPKKKKYGIN